MADDTQSGFLQTTGQSGRQHGWLVGGRNLPTAGEVAGHAKPSGDLNVGKEDTVVVKESLRGELGDRQQVGRVELQLGWMVMPPRRHAQKRVPKPLVEFYELSSKGPHQGLGKTETCHVQPEGRSFQYFSVNQPSTDRVLLSPLSNSCPVSIFAYQIITSDTHPRPPRVSQPRDAACFCPCSFVAHSL